MDLAAGTDAHHSLVLKISIFLNEPSLSGFSTPSIIVYVLADVADALVGVY